MIAVETRWFAWVGKSVRLFISLGDASRVVSDRNSINTIMPVGTQR